MSDPINQDMIDALMASYKDDVGVKPVNYGTVLAQVQPTTPDEPTQGTVSDAPVKLPPDLAAQAQAPVDPNAPPALQQMQSTQASKPITMDMINQAIQSRNMNSGNEFTRGVMRGVDSTGSLLEQGIPAVAKSAADKVIDQLGFDAPFDPTSNLKEYNKEEQQTNLNYPTATPSYKDISDLSSLAGYVESAGGESVPSLAFSLGSGAISGAIGKTALQTMAKKAGETLTESELNSAMTRGTLMGAGISSAALNIPSSYFDLLQQGKDDPLAAVAVGGLQTALQVAPEARLLNRIFGPEGNQVLGQSIIGSIGREAATTGSLIGATSGATQALNDIATHLVVTPNKDLFTPDNINGWIDASLKGAVGGIIAGAGGGALAHEGSITGMPKTEDFGSVMAKMTPEGRAAVQNKLAETSVPTPIQVNSSDVTDSSVLPPLYTSDAHNVLLSNNGIDIESTKQTPQVNFEQLLPQDEPTGNQEELPKTGISSGDDYDAAFQAKQPDADLEQVKSDAKAMQQPEPSDDSLITTLSNATSLNDVYTPDYEKPINPQEQQQATARKAAIKKGQRPDLNFMPGDGEIVYNPKEQVDPNPPSPTQNPLDQIQVTDGTKINKKVAAAKAMQAATPATVLGDQLPRDVRNIKPRYNYGKDNFPIQFPSDVEKAIYTVGNPNTKSSKHDVISKWLADKGYTKRDIASHFKTMKDSFKEQVQNLPAGETVKAPAFPDNDDASLQRSAPVQGSLNETAVFPRVLKNNLEMVNLTPEAKSRYGDLLASMHRIIKEIVGPGINLKPYASIREKLSGDNALGAQFLNNIALALNKTTDGKQIESMYHETWHQMERLGRVNDSHQFTERLTKYLGQDEHLKNVPYDLLMASPEGQEEIRANAFGKWAMEQHGKGNEAGIKIPDVIPSVFHKNYRDIIRYIRRVKNMLNGNGFNKYEDVFSDVYQGNRAASDPLQNMLYTNKYARLQRISDAAHEAYKQQFNDDLGKTVEDAKREANDRFEQYGRIGNWSKFISSFHHASKDEPMTAQIYVANKRKIDSFNGLLSKYVGIMKDYQNSDKAIRYKLHDILDYNRRTGQKGQIDDQGRLSFVKNDKAAGEYNSVYNELTPNWNSIADGEKVTIQDPEIGAKYKQLQDTYGEAINDYEKMLRQVSYNKHPELMGDPNITPRNLKKAVDNIPVMPSNQEAIDNLTNLHDQLNAIGKMRQSDFAPQQRYGDWGIKVVDRATGEMKDFFTVESGNAIQNMTLKKNKMLYNDYQMGKVLDAIKTHYADQSKYKIIGGRGEITDFNDKANLIPFKMNYNKLKETIDPRFLNIETLSSLLHSSNIDPSQFEAVRNQLYNDILTRGFKNRLAKADSAGIGYSRDWDRVNHSYFSGAARFFAGVPHAAFLAKFATEVADLRDEHMIKKLNKYSDYTNSVQDDYQSLRAFNFLWAMGGNLSTSLIHMYTLPTMTLGQLNQFHPNVIDNMATINKWLATGLKYYTKDGIKSVYSKDGLMNINFGDSDIIKKMVADGVMDQATAAHLAKSYINLRGQQLEDFVGHSPFETSSFGGNAKKTLNKMGYYLGVPLSYTEQMTRFATNMAAFDTLHSNPDALARANDLLKNDKLYQAMKSNNPAGYSDAENLSNYIMDNSHAVFGKYARSPYMRGIGGALFFPFTTTTHQFLENLGDLYRHGGDGKRALALTLGSMMFFGGLMGLPGAQLVKGIAEQLKKELTGTESDFDLLIREAIYKETGSARAAKFVTQGFGRAFMGIDMTKRVGLQVPGTDLFQMMTGESNAPADDAFGVAGSLVDSMGKAWQAYNTGDTSNVFSSLMPSTAGNLVKAVSMVGNGIKTANGYQLLTPSDIAHGNGIPYVTPVMKALGITSDQLATSRENLYYGKILANRQYQGATDAYRAQATNAYQTYKEADDAGNHEQADQALDNYRAVIKNYINFSVANKIPLDMQAFNRSVIMAAQQRVSGQMSMKDLKKGPARQGYSNIENVLGITQ